METISYLGNHLRRWNIGSSTFLAWPEAGARLLNWNLKFGDGSFRDVLYWPELDSLSDIAKVRGGNPILFPFPARTYHEGALGSWKSPDGEVRPMPMHGIARQGRFELVHLSKVGFQARLLPTERDMEAYPFSYDFTVAYQFAESSFFVELALKNRDQVPIPWSAGHHFYFSLPSSPNLSRADYRVCIPAEQAYMHASNGALVDVGKPAHEESLDAPHLVDRIHTGLTSNSVLIENADGDERIRIIIGPQPRPEPHTAVVTWTECDEAPFYCVEPWMGPPNSPEHKVGLHWVKPGETEVFLVEVRMEIDHQPRR